MDIDLSAIKLYNGNVFINGTKCDKNKIQEHLDTVTDTDIVIQLLPGMQKVIVQPWMTSLNALYNFHTTMNNGITMPCTVMYGIVTDYSEKLYYCQLAIQPNQQCCWNGFIPRSAVINIESV